jgi:hypothetical protein
MLCAIGGEAAKYARFACADGRRAGDLADPVRPCKGRPLADFHRRGRCAGGAGDISGACPAANASAAAAAAVDFAGAKRKGAALLVQPVLVGQLLPQIGMDAWASMGNRLLTIGVMVVYGAAVLITLRPARRVVVA